MYIYPTRLALLLKSIPHLALTDWRRLNRNRPLGEAHDGQGDGICAIDGMASGALIDSIVAWVWLMSVQVCMAQTLTLPLRLRPVIGNTEILDRDGSSKGVLA